MHVRTPTAGLLTRVPVQLYVFDVLHLGGSSTLELAYTRRRWMLDDLGLDDDVTKTPPFWTNDAGKDLMRSAGELGREGVVAKRLESRYQPGARSRWWIKTPLNKTVEVVIAGWKPGSGRREGIVGSLRAAPRAAVSDGHGPGGRACSASRPRRCHCRDRELRSGSPMASRTLPRRPARRFLAPGWWSRPQRTASPPGEPHRCLLLPPTHATVGGSEGRDPSGSGLGHTYERSSSSRSTIMYSWCNSVLGHRCTAHLLDLTYRWLSARDHPIAALVARSTSAPVCRGQA